MMQLLIFYKTQNARFIGASISRYMETTSILAISFYAIIKTFTSKTKLRFQSFLYGKSKYAMVVPLMPLPDEAVKEVGALMLEGGSVDSYRQNCE